METITVTIDGYAYTIPLTLEYTQTIQPVPVVVVGANDALVDSLQTVSGGVLASSVLFGALTVGILALLFVRMKI